MASESPVSCKISLYTSDDLSFSHLDGIGLVQTPGTLGSPVVELPLDDRQEVLSLSRINDSNMRTI